MSLKTASMLLVAGVASVVAASPALAQTAPYEPPPALSAPEPAAPPAPAPETYSGQIVAADLGGLLLLGTLAGATNQGTFVLLAPLAAPTVHVVHGHPGRALGSLLLNVSLPVLGAIAGYGIDTSSCGGEEFFCGLGGLVLGGAVGMATAIALDAAVLARLPEETEAPPARTAATRGVTPLLAMGRDGSVSFGVGGRF